MKNKIYILGLLSSIFIISGGILKINHLAGAGICLTLGILFLCIVFMPIAVISANKDEGKKRTLLYLAIYLTIVTDFSGGLFKIMHWPGAGILMIIGVLSPVFIFLSVYLYYHYREREESSINFLYIMFLLVYLSVMSSLLALNVSKEILDQALISEKLINMNEYRDLKSKLHNEKTDKIAELNNRTDQILKEIKNLKKELALWGNDDNKAAININHDVNLFLITNKDSRDASGTILFGKKEAENLKAKIEEYRNYLISFSKSEKITSDIMFTDILKTSDYQIDDENKISWETCQFEGYPLVMNLKDLTLIESNIILAESEIISNLFYKEITQN